PFRGPSAGRGGRLDEAAGGPVSQDGPFLGRQLPPECAAMVRPADGSTRRFRRDADLLLHPGASRDCAASHQPAARRRGVRRILRQHGAAVLSRASGASEPTYDWRVICWVTNSVELQHARWKHAAGHLKNLKSEFLFCSTRKEVASLPSTSVSFSRIPMTRRSAAAPSSRAGRAHVSYWLRTVPPGT